MLLKPVNLGKKVPVSIMCVQTMFAMSERESLGKGLHSIANKNVFIFLYIGLLWTSELIQLNTNFLKMYFDTYLSKMAKHR